LIRKAQFRVDDFFIVDQDAVIDFPNSDDAHALWLFNILKKPEGPCRRDFSFEKIRAFEKVAVLLQADRLRLLQNIADRKAFGGFDADVFSRLVSYSIRLIHNDFRTLLFLSLDTGFLDQMTKLYGYTIT